MDTPVDTQYLDVRGFVCVCLWVFMLCFVLIQKNTPTVEGSSLCRGEPGWEGLV